MNTESIIDKIKKLRKLAADPSNIHEAANAAAMATKLIERYKIQAHLLEDVEKRSGNEPIVERVIYTFDGPKAATWLIQLASGIGALNGVKVFYAQARGTSPLDVVCPTCGARYQETCSDEDGTEMEKPHSPRFKKVRREFRETETFKKYGKATISGVGTAEDLDVVEEMTRFLSLEVERLHEEDPKRPRGSSKEKAKAWGMSFRNGAVITIKDRCAAAQKELRKEMENEARIADHAKGGGSFALALVQQAIVHVEARLEKAEEHVEKHIKLRKGGVRSLGKSWEGFAAGREAGKRADITGHKRKKLEG